ncbi:MAG: DUF4180 domain-containing protein [Prevotellaceae bacterium]|jgi:hypothetical protein|nr:DUF4180 domain-containing protein [Prevotellaceae bacterium]
MNNDFKIFNTVEDILDMIVNITYQHNCDSAIIGKEQLNPDFFDLKTGFAGEILQKFVTYNIRLGIVGDFSAITSKNFRDFIYESNKVGQIVFAKNAETATELLTDNGRRACKIYKFHIN